MRTYRHSEETEKFDPHSTSVFRLSLDFAIKAIFFGDQVVDELMVSLIGENGKIRLAVSFSEYLMSVCEETLEEAEGLTNDESSFLLETFRWAHTVVLYGELGGTLQRPDAKIYFDDALATLSKKRGKKEPLATRSQRRSKIPLCTTK